MANSLKIQLSNLAKKWPKGGSLVYHIEDDHVWLHKIHLPKSHRGQGTKHLCEFLSLTDQAQLSVCLTADPMPQEGGFDVSEPDTFHLVRWYNRFGFESFGPSEDGFLMQRKPGSPKSTPQTILQTYNQNKKSDLTLSAFERLSQPSPSKVHP